MTTSNTTRRYKRQKADSLRPPIPLEGFGVDPKLDCFVWGVQQIAVIINRTDRETFYLAERGLIDVDKVGTRWRSTPRRLLRPQRAEASRRIDAAE